VAPPVATPTPAGNAGAIKVPEVQVTQPDPVVKKPTPPVAAAPKKPPVKTATPPAPQPVQSKPTAPAPVAAAPVSPPVAPGQQVKLSPVGGEVPIDKYAGSVSAVSASDIASGGSTNTTDALQQRVPGVIVTDASGNSFQQEVNYRGFNSSSVNGSPQGLAVYQNGVRVNEIFGDTVNWDLIPSIAISDIAVISGNPVYGLNAIGGAITITMKDGFSFQGTEIDARFGSFGRRQVTFQHGAKYGNVATYVAVEGIKDDGWRDRSDSLVKRGYADLGYKDERQEYHLNVTGATNRLGATAATPIELLNQRYSSIYTTPQVVENKLAMLSFNGAYALTSSTKLSGNLYYRKLKSKKIDGNVSDVVDCDPRDRALAGLLCFDEIDNPLNTATGGIASLGLAKYGSIDRSSEDADGLGGSAQIVEKSKLFGLGNQLLVGASIDTGRLTSKSSSELGVIDPNSLVVGGLGVILTDAGVAGVGDNIDSIKPVDLGVRTNYYGIYISDTLDLTDRFALTLGGRYNIAEIKLRDRTGGSPELNGNNRFERFNPVVGGAYKLTPNATLFGGYSEANRAPTPTELACSDPLRPCLLANFLAADPPLKQVVSHTFEGGLRGAFGTLATGGKLDWSVALYRTENDDDIISVASAQAGRGYFQNAGTTRRQGVDLALNYKDDRFSAYAGYGYVDATFQSNLELPAGNNPGAAVTPCSGGTGNCILVTPGNKLTGVPAHRFKAGFDYMLTNRWLFGADFVAASDQFFRGDENNANAKLAGYGIVNLHSSYDVNKNVQLYGLVNNVFDSKYALFGTYYSAADLALITGGNFSDNRTVVPGAPLAGYGGVKIKF
jgi:outer membrane receptor protein involved in Fe transport